MATTHMGDSNRTLRVGLASMFLLSVVFAPAVTFAAFSDGVYGGGIFSGEAGSVSPGGGGACVNCGTSGSSGGGTKTETDEGTGTTSSSTDTTYRCPDTAPVGNGLSGAGLVNLLVSLGIIPSGKAKTACDALTPETSTPTSTTADTFRFTTPFKKGDRSEEVRRLQQFLNTHGFTLASGTELGAPGYETDLFGLLTFDAVKRFQAAYTAEILTPVGLTVPSGYWGPSTMKKANALLGV